MGAGLAAQRGWPQGRENEPTSPHSTEGTTTSAGEEPSARRQQARDHGGVGNDLLLYEEVARAEVQPLEDGEYARNYGSAASLTSLVPLDRKQSTLVDENGGEAEDAGTASAFQNDWDSVPGQSEPLEQRDGREMSVAYDLGAVLSTEDEIRHRFNFRPSRGPSPGEVVDKVKRKVARKFRSPLALLNFVLPITKQLNTYTSEKLARDLVVGTTMATLMIPQGLAFATVAGIPLLYGLYIVWAPPFFYSLFGVSLHVSYGPFALVGLFISDALAKRGYQPCDGLCRHDTEETRAYLEACTMITFMVSMWYFLMAIFKLGEPLAILLADPVISGFVTASAILVANSQVCTFFQIQHPARSDIVGTFIQLWEARAYINWWSVAMGVGSMLVYFALRRFNAYIKSKGAAGFFVPEALSVVILSTFLSWAFDLEGTQGVDIVGTIPPGLPAPKFPRLDKLTSLAQVEDMAGVALVAAIVSFIITHSIAKSLAGAQEIKATPQLFAFGVANLAGSIFSALPGSASLSRAAIIDALGARTIIHNVFTFSLMTLVLLFLSPLLKFLPTSVLAATIFAVIYKFFHFDEPFKLYRVGMADTVMWLATFAATMGLSVKDGIVVGMAVSAFTLIQRSSSPLVMHMGLLPGTTLYRDIKTYPDAQRQPGVEVLRFGASLTFANKDVFRRTVIKVVEKADNERRLAELQGHPTKVPLQYVILDSSSIHDLDSSSLKTLESLVALLVDRDPPIEMFLAPVSDPLMVQIRKSPLLCATIGRRYFLSTATAVQYALQQIAGGPLVAPAALFQTVMSSISLGNLDEKGVDDI
eukprot:g14582.t1